MRASVASELLRRRSVHRSVARSEHRLSIHSGLSSAACALVRCQRYNHPGLSETSEVRMAGTGLSFVGDSEERRATAERWS